MISETKNTFTISSTDLIMVSSTFETADLALQYIINIEGENFHYSQNVFNGEKNYGLEAYDSDKSLIICTKNKAVKYLIKEINFHLS